MKITTRACVPVFPLMLVLFATVGCEKSPPPDPTHHVRVGENEIPAFDLKDAEEVDLEDFQFVTLPDGHDYWIYRRNENGRGFAAMAHSPECKKCVDRTR